MPNTILTLDVLDQILASIKSNISGGPDISIPLSVANGGTGVTSLSSLQSEVIGNGYTILNQNRIMLANNVTPSGTMTKSIIVGYYSRTLSATFNNCIVMGTDCANNTYQNDGSILIGDNIGKSTQSHTFKNSVVIGHEAMNNNALFPNEVTVIGCSAARAAQQPSNFTCIGYRAAENVKSARSCVVIGSRAGSASDELYFDQGVAIGAGVAVSNENSDRGSVNVGYVAGQGRTRILESVNIGWNAGASSTVSENTNTHEFTFTRGGSIIYSTIVGSDAGVSNGTDVVRSVAVGHDAFYMTGGVDGSVGVGRAVGSLGSATHVESVMIGDLAGKWRSTKQCVGVGAWAFYYSDYSAATVLTNDIAIGYHSTVTGDNQCQLGNSSVTTYVYGSVQNRSDRRDKANITDLEYDYKTFISKLKPRNFQWDYREDYIPEPVRDDEGNIINEDETQIQMDQITPDGTHARSRRHNGFIAQEVKEVMDEMGFDFAGYQDHSVNGGQDVLSLGYEEFIAPMVACIQDLMKENQQFRDEVAAIKQHLQL